MAAHANDPRRDALPPRVLPLLYIGTAHASLALALASVAWRPQAVTGFGLGVRLLRLQPA